MKYLLRVLLLSLLLLPQLASAATITWTVSNGDFNNKNNWSTKTVPGPGDTAVISSGTFYATSQITAGTVLVSSAYKASTSSDFDLNVTGNWTFSGGFTLAAGHIFYLHGGGTVTVSGTTTLSTARLYVYDNSTLTFSGLTTYAPSTNVEWDAIGGTLNFTALKTITGSPVYFYSDGGEMNFAALTSVAKGSVYAIDQSDVSFPALTSVDGLTSIDAIYNSSITFASVTTASANGEWSVQDYYNDGTNYGGGYSVLSFPALKTIVGTSAPGQSFTITASGSAYATGGGLVDLPVLTSITKADDGQGGQDYTLSLTSSSGATISAPKLTAFTDNNPNGYSSVSDSGSGTISFPQLTSVTHVNFNLSAANLPPITSYAGNLTITGGNATLSTLTSLTGNITVNGGAMIDFLGLSNPGFTGVGTVTVGGGAQVAFSHLTKITGSTDFEVDGGTLTLASLTTINNATIRVGYNGDGGTINLPVLTTITSGTVEVGYSYYGSGGVPATLSVPALTSVNGLSLISVYGGSQVSFPSVTSFSRSTTATWSIEDYLNSSDPRVYSLLSFPALTTITGPASAGQYLYLNAQGYNDSTGGGTISLPVLTSITQGDDGSGYPDSGVQVNVTYGATFSAPQLTTFNDNAAFPSSSITTDATGILALPGLTSVIGVNLNVTASDVPSQLTSLTGNLTINSGLATLSTLSAIHGSITVNGGAQVDFPSLTNASFTDSKTVTINGGAVVTMAGVTNVAGSIDFEVDGGTLTLVALTSINNATIRVGYYGNSGTLNLPSLTTINTGTVEIGGNGYNYSSVPATLSLPALTSVNGLSLISVYGGSQLTFPSVTSYASSTTANWNVYDYYNYSDPRVYSLLSFPALTTITGPAAAGQYLYLTAQGYNDGTGGGTISLPALTSITQGDDGSGYADSGVGLSATYGATISAPQLTTFQDNAVFPGSGITTDSTGIIATPGLTSLVGVNLNVYGTATLLPQLTSFSGYLKINGGTASLGSLTSITGTLRTESGAQATFPVLAVLTGALSIQADNGTMTFPALTTMAGGSVDANNQSTLSFPLLTSVDGLSEISASYGSKITFASVTTAGGSANWSVSDQSNNGNYGGLVSQLNFPALTSIAVGSDPGLYFYISANGSYFNSKWSGIVNLPVLTSITKADDAVGYQDSGIQLSANYSAIISAPNLASFRDYSVNPGSSLNNNGTGAAQGILDMSLLQTASLTGVAVNGVTVSGQVLKAYAAIPDHAYGTPFAAPLPPGAAVGNGHPPVIITVVSGPATITNNIVTLTGVGTVTIAANQGANLFYKAAKQVTATFNAVKGTQTITFPPIADTPSNTPPLTLGATASSGLGISYTLVSGPATLANNVLTLTGTGVVTLTASQAGDANWIAATPVTISFNVTLAAQTIAAFAPIADQVFSATPFTVTVPVATSGLPVTLSVLSGPATVSGNSVTLTGLGTVVLAADQPGAATYAPATQVTVSFQVTLAPQTIAAFATIADRLIGATPITQEVTAPVSTSGLPVTLSVVSGPATLSGTTLTISGPGTVTLAADQGGNATFSPAAQVTTSFNVTTNGQTIAPFPAIPNHTFGDAPFDVVLTSTSGLPVTLSVVSGPATVSGTKVTLTGAGTVVLAGDQAGDATFAAAAQVTTSFTVGIATQTITFPAIPSTPASSVITLGATASSGLPVTYTLVSGPASLSGNLLTVASIGTVKVTASQAGNASVSPAADVTITFSVTKGGQTINFPPVADQPFGVKYTLVATTSSGLPVNYALVSGPATLTGKQLTFTGLGLVKIVGTQPGSSSFTAAPAVFQTIKVIKGPQTINFPGIAKQTWPISTMKLNATASSGLPITYAVSGVATVSGNVLTITKPGTINITARQLGGTNYLAAPQVTVQFNVAKTPQGLTFPAIPAHVFGDAPFALNVTSSSGLPVTYTAGGAATISGNMVTIFKAGTVKITASQAGDTYNAAALSVAKSFAVAKAPQSITFPAIAAHKVGDTFTLSVTASSGLPVTLSVSSGAATITGNTVKVTGSGTIRIKAVQNGNANIAAAPSLLQTFTATP